MHYVKNELRRNRLMTSNNHMQLKQFRVVVIQPQPHRA